ncbi:type II toxin-antitoxin system VapC family toxin [Candidatus Lokiarchaeum ossiferum]|uniref:type II toxin-antitoxin system VapC family toxin n=1 Tax=Candidatus Lokiarchaeum ossiferum TaxID=2951803 RepID=UPI00352CBBE8
MVEKAVIDAQVLFYFHYTYEKVPLLLRELKQKVINRELTVIIPTIAISELLWKMRKIGKVSVLKEAIKRWEESENVIIDNFDLETVKLMLENKESHELHDEIIAMTCKKYNTNIIYATDKKFKEVFHLILRSWK